MKKYLSTLCSLSLFVLVGLLLPNTTTESPDLGRNDDLRAATFRILESKCNSCHRKRNPFMVFRQRNMDKRADRIYRAIFVRKRMPKAGGEPLTVSEIDTLQQWLQTKITQP